MAAAAFLSVAPPVARAANFFWDTNGGSAGLGGTGTWDTTTANWFNAGSATTTNGLQPTAAIGAFTSNDVAYFSGAAGSSNTVTLGQAITIGGLNFSGLTSYVLDGASALTLAAPSGTPTQPTVAVASGSRVNVTAKISGTQGLLKTGNGTLVLGNSANDFTGDLLIRGGAVVITASAQLGAGTGPVMVQGFSNTGNPGFSGGSLVVQGGITGISVSREISASGRGPNAANASGAILSVGNNNFTGGVTLGTQTETRFHASPGVTTVSGDFSLGAGAGTVLYGDGNFVISGKIVSYDAGQDRLVKTGLLYPTSLWIQGDQNRFNGTIRTDSGWVRVTDPTNLGLNRSFQNVDFNNGNLEVRTGLTNWINRNLFFRNNVSGNLFLDHGLGDTSGPSSLVGQTIAFGNLSKGTGNNNTNYNFSSRNGFGASFTGFGGFIGTTDGTAGNYGDFTVNNNLSGPLTFSGDIWRTNTGGTNVRTLFSRVPGTRFSPAASSPPVARTSSPSRDRVRPRSKVRLAPSPASPRSARAPSSSPASPRSAVRRAS